MKAEIEWISSEERLPEIPRDKKGITVLAVVFDPHYAQLDREYKGDVETMMYTRTYGWTDSLIGQKPNDVSFTYCTMPVTYWAYKPDFPDIPEHLK